MEAFSPYYAQAYDFLVAIAEPVSRPEFIHQYRVSTYSLYAAVAVGIDAADILTVLARLCKTQVPPEMVDFVEKTTSSYGKAKLVLKHSRHALPQPRAIDRLAYAFKQKAAVRPNLSRIPSSRSCSTARE